MTKPKPLDNDQIIKAIQDALGPRGRIFPSKHIRERMNERHFEISDAIKVLEERKKIKPSWNTNTGTWNYDVEGHDNDGHPLTIRIAVAEEGLVLVTGF